MRGIWARKWNWKKGKKREAGNDNANGRQQKKTSPAGTEPAETATARDNMGSGDGVMETAFPGIQRKRGRKGTAAAGPGRETTARQNS